MRVLERNTKLIYFTFYDRKSLIKFFKQLIKISQIKESKELCGFLSLDTEFANTNENQNLHENYSENVSIFFLHNNYSKIPNFS